MENITPSNPACFLPASLTVCVCVCHVAIIAHTPSCTMSAPLPSTNPTFPSLNTVFAEVLSSKNDKLTVMMVIDACQSNCDGYAKYSDAVMAI